MGILRERGLLRFEDGIKCGCTCSKAIIDYIHDTYSTKEAPDQQEFANEKKKKK